LNNSSTGASNINTRVAIGAIMLKHLLIVSDRVANYAIQEILYIQYLLGFDRFIAQTPFDSSLFVEIRKSLGMDELNRISNANCKILTGNL
jgi:hypothetical protein